MSHGIYSRDIRATHAFDTRDSNTTFETGLRVMFDTLLVKTYMYT